VSKNIKVTICSEVDIEQSNVEEGLYVHSYTVHLENIGLDTVQLLSRKWIINNQYGSVKIVEGEGVVGEKPIIQPGETYVYSSFCVLECNFGSMQGHYIFKNRESQEKFKVDIPRFKLENRWILN